jgi:hypothetical protein
MATIYGLFYKDECLYIGSTIEYEVRINQHKSTQGSNKSCGSSFIPVGIEWEDIILDVCDESERWLIESKYIEALNPTYNKKKGQRLLRKEKNKQVWANLERIELKSGENCV